jgi:hypothetical protein
MAPRAGSRFMHSLGLRDAEGRLFLTEREPFRFSEFADTRLHLVAEGDTLFHLAGTYFAPLPRACGYWWAIADFQPQPMHDPTLALPMGNRLFIPSVRALEEFLSDRAPS